MPPHVLPRAFRAPKVEFERVHPPGWRDGTRDSVREVGGPRPALHNDHARPELEARGDERHVCVVQDLRAVLHDAREQVAVQREHVRSHACTPRGPSIARVSLSRDGASVLRAHQPLHVERRAALRRVLEMIHPEGTAFPCLEKERT